MKEWITQDELEKVGQRCREADDGNLLVGSFAAELAGESYPFSKEMCGIMFQPYTDAELGEKFVKWMMDYERNQRRS